MINIRKNVFETNSSSTHSICISKKPAKNIPDEIVFHPGEFGWEQDVVFNTGDYLYTGILDGPSDLVQPRLEKLKKMLDEIGIKYSFCEPKTSKFGGYVGCYIDHSYELADFINAVLSGKDLLIRYLFSDSCIYTGNDNYNEPDDLCYSADEMIWDENTNEYIPNPNYHLDKYDYFFKGN